MADTPIDMGMVSGNAAAPSATTAPAPSPASPVTPAPARESFAQARLRQDQAAAGKQPPRPSAAENPRARGHSPSREVHEAAAARAQSAEPSPVVDQQQPVSPAGDAAARVQVGQYETDEKELGELKTWKAAEDSRKLTLPQSPDAYKVELPPDFKPPAGVEYKVDAADPALGQFKQWMHKHGIPQDAGNELFGIFAGREVGTQARIDAARAAEVGKLGPTGPSRVDAVTRFMDASGLGVLKSTLVTAAQVEAVEAHMAKLTSQGSASFSQSHRVPADDKTTIPGYERMSFEQRRFAQDQQRARNR